MNSRKQKIKKSFYVLTIIILLLTFTGCSNTTITTDSNSSPRGVTSDLQVHFIDVGQGDCTLITSDGKAMLIDAGNNDKGTLVQSYLQKQDISTLDVVICTHGDSDHSGGIDVILTKFDCKTVIMPDTDKVMSDTKTFRDVLSAMKSKSYKNTLPVVGDTFPLGNATVTIIAPNSYDYGDNPNDYSVGILVQNGDNRFLFTGDAEEAAEADILNNGIDISADVFKVAHHGANTANTDAFLEAINPTYAVISCGEGNTYGHPRAEVLNNLRAAATKVFRTDEQGTIVATSDGTDITWNCSPSDSWKAGEPTGNSTGNKAETESGSNSSTANNSLDIEEFKVYVTDSGSKYHLAGCTYLSESSNELLLKEAKKEGYTPCSKCNPPD